jgi:multidrug resistance efflux pump
MFRYAVIIIALIGLGVGFYAAATTKQELPRPAPAQPPSINPYPRGIAATGLVEAATRNIAIAAPEPGQVAQVNVNVGDTIKKDQALFIIDKRPLEAELLRANAAKAQAEAELARLKSLPRPEDVPPLEAAVNRAAALLRDATDEYQRLQRTLQGAAATQSEVNRKKFAMEAAAADLEAAKANLARMKAGAWEKEISIAQAQLAKANADIEAICVRIDRLVVKSPIDGVVIKRNIEPGEFASPGSAGATGMSDPSMIIGDLSKLNVRAQVDQEDVALLKVGSAAVARPRGPGDTLMPMEMIRIEPMAMPKRQITGLASELVDTRIVEVLFRVADTKGLNVYPGQMVDVFIDARHEAK